MKFFFDRNMSKYLATMMAIYERTATVVHLDDDGRFIPTTPDVEWIRILAADETPWIILSGDARILRNRVERGVLEEAKLTFFCMGRTWSHMDVNEYAWKFLKIWPSILEKASSPTKRIYEVSGTKVDVVSSFR